MDVFFKNFFSTFFACFVSLILFFSFPGFSFALQNQQANFADESNVLVLGNGINGTNTDAQPNPTADPSSNSNPSSSSSASSGQSCSVSRLTPQEAKGIMDLTHEGFNGKKISPADVNDSPARDLGDVKLTGKDLDGKTAVQVKAPNIAGSADKYSFFNNLAISGPFGIGLILDDTLRIGRCTNLNQKDCKIFGEGLLVRTSGVGFKSDLVNAFESVKTATGEVKSIVEANLSTKDLNKVKNNYLTDLNTADFTVGAFGTGEQIKSSSIVQQYNARNVTTCNNSACTISTYSAFDKYYNAWFTTDMFVSTVGPTLLHKANKALTKAFKSYSISDPLNSRLAKLMKLREKVVGIPTELSQRLIAGEPSKMIGQARVSRFKALIQEEGFGDVFDPFIYKNRALWSSGGGGEIDKLMKMDSPIWKYSPEKRQKFFEAVEHLRAYSRANAIAVDAAKSQFDEATKLAKNIADETAKQTALDAAKMEYGRKMANYLDDWDEILALDFEAWAKTNEDLFSFGGLAVRKGGDYPEGQGYVDISTGAPFNLKRIVQKFRDNGDWSEWAATKNAGEFQTAPIRDAAGNITGYSNAIQLYRIQPSKLVAENVALDDLKLRVANMGRGVYSVKLPNGKYLPLDSSTIDYIASQPRLIGAVNIYEGGYAPVEPLTPLDMANRLSDPRLASRPKTAARNMDEIHNALVQNEYAGRKYYSLLDQQYANEGDMIKAYYKNPQVGIWKGTILPIAYWNLKKGFGQEDYSAIMLPDSWSTLTVSQGTDKLYNDSFIDFFANEGSDQGDMFKRAFQTLPFVWNRAIEMAISTNQYVEEMFTKYSGGFLGQGSGTRDEVLDLAFYSHNENCSNCSGSMKYDNGYLGLIGMRAETNLQAFILEATDDETKKKSGATIVSYTHHSNIKGKSGQIDGDGIDLVEAEKNNETCDQKLRELGFGGFFSTAGSATGGILAVAENAAYFAGFGPGLIASFFQQMYFARELQDCVDDKEGYYIHFYSPAPKEASANKSKEILSNENVSSALSELTQQVDSVVKENSSTQSKEPTNPVENSIDKLKQQFEEFSNKSKKANILQASVDLLPPSRTTLIGKEIFYIWFKEKAMPIGYRDKGKTVTTDGNISVEKDYENGTLKINGETVLGKDKADHTRLITQDNRIPAEVVPMTLNKVSAPMNSGTVFELIPAGKNGEIFVRNQQVLDCIQKAVFDQSGIEFSGNELTQVFGALEKINTEKYESITSSNGKIFLEGSSPRAEGEQGSRFIIDGYWNSKLVADANNNLDTGKFVGMAFEHGTIILKPETNELIIWLRQHAGAVLTNKDVKGLNATPTTVLDPETECNVPAIDLEAIPYQNDELGAQRVDKFNTSMKHLGPFTQFITDTKIYEFYSKRDEATGECKDFFRVRDKDTGKILTDSEIVGGIKLNDDGSISFKTADGKEHNLLFDAENGVPKVSYNGGPPETLLTAQGPNGSFWYDPNTGQWYPENGLMIPLNQAFKDNGAWFETGKDGSVTGTGDNKMTFNIGQQGTSGFNIPSMPETAAGIVLFVTAFLLIAFTFTRGRKKDKNKC